MYSLTFCCFPLLLIHSHSLFPTSCLGGSLFRNNPPHSLVPHPRTPILLAHGHARYPTTPPTRIRSRPKNPLLLSWIIAAPVVVTISCFTLCIAAAGRAETGICGETGLTRAPVTVLVCGTVGGGVAGSGVVSWRQTNGIFLCYHGRDGEEVLKRVRITSPLWVIWLNSSSPRSLRRRWMRQTRYTTSLFPLLGLDRLPRTTPATPPLFTA